MLFHEDIRITIQQIGFCEFDKRERLSRLGKTYFKAGPQGKAFDLSDPLEVPPFTRTCCTTGRSKQTLEKWFGEGPQHKPAYKVDTESEEHVIGRPSLLGRKDEKLLQHRFVTGGERSGTSIACGNLAHERKGLYEADNRPANIAQKENSE